MRKIFLAAALAALTFPAAHASAAVDINKATPAELEAVPGIGASMSARIVDERKKKNFKNWDDVTARVKGIKAGKAAKLSAGGLTVDGAAYAGGGKASAAPAPKAKASAH